MTPELPVDARARLDAHLDAVEEALQASGGSRKQRCGIVDDLESQILEMLARRSATPVLSDVEEVLGTLDSPEAYRSPRDVPAKSPAEPARETPPPLPVVNIQAPDSSSSEASHAPSQNKRSLFMRPSVLITLIVCGMLLVMTPAFTDHLKDVQNQQSMQQAMALLATRTDLHDFKFDRAVGLEDTAKFGFWFTGTMAIVAGCIGGFIAFWHDGKR